MAGSIHFITLPLMLITDAKDFHHEVVRKWRVIWPEHIYPNIYLSDSHPSRCPNTTISKLASSQSLLLLSSTLNLIFIKLWDSILLVVGQLKSTISVLRA